MANPQLENGFTRIANEIMDALVRMRIPGEARQVLDFIIRQTYGYNQKTAAISLGDFSDATSLSKVHVVLAIKRLVDMNVIIVTEKGNESLPNTVTLPKKVTKEKLFEFNKDYETWQALPKKVTLPKKVKVITEKGNESLPNTVTNVTEKGNAIGREPSTDANPQTPKDNKDNKDILKTCPKSFLPNAPAYRLAALLLDEIIKANPLSRLKALSNGRREATVQNWAIHIDKLIRLDHQEPSIVEEVIKFAVYDGFWGTNILSTDALRRNWDRLVKEMQKKGKLPKPEPDRPIEPESIEGKRFVVYGGWITKIGEKQERYGRYEKPETVIKKFGVDFSECLIESDRAPLHTKGVDVSKYTVLRPQPDGVYDLEREIRRQA